MASSSAKSCLKTGTVPHEVDDKVLKFGQDNVPVDGVDVCVRLRHLQRGMVEGTVSTQLVKVGAPDQFNQIP
jgi:hypothetical protein